MPLCTTRFEHSFGALHEEIKRIVQQITANKKCKESTHDKYMWPESKPMFNWELGLEEKHERFQQHFLLFLDSAEASARLKLKKFTSKIIKLKN
jgi:hypothetical protein